MASDVSLMVKVAHRLSYGLNVLFTLSNEVADIHVEVKMLCLRLINHLPDLQELEMVGCIRNPGETATYLGIFIEIVSDLGEICKEIANESTLLSSTPFSSKNRLTIISLNNKLTWVFESLGYAGSPLLPRQDGSIMHVQFPNITEQCNHIYDQRNHSTPVQTFIVSGQCSAFYCRSMSDRLIEKGFIDYSICVIYQGSDYLTILLILNELGMLDKAHVGNPTKILMRILVDVLRNKKLSIVVKIPKGVESEFLSESILLSGYLVGKKSSVGWIPIFVCVKTVSTNLNPSIPHITSRSLSSSHLCSLSSMYLLRLLREPSKMIIQRQLLRNILESNIGTPKLASLLGRMLNVITTSVTDSCNSSERQMLIDVLQGLQDSCSVDNILSKLIPMVPPPPIQGCSVDEITSKLCFLFETGTFTCFDACTILCIPFMSMLTTLRQFVVIGICQDHYECSNPTFSIRSEFVRYYSNSERVPSNKIKIIQKGLPYYRSIVSNINSCALVSSRQHAIKLYFYSRKIIRTIIIKSLKLSFFGSKKIIISVLLLVLQCVSFENNFLGESTSESLEICKLILKNFKISNDVENDIQKENKNPIQNNDCSELVDIPLEETYESEKGERTLLFSDICKRPKHTFESLTSLIRNIKICSNDSSSYWTVVLQEMNTCLDNSSADCSVHMDTIQQHPNDSSIVLILSTLLTCGELISSEKHAETQQLVVDISIYGLAVLRSTTGNSNYVGGDELNQSSKLNDIDGSYSEISTAAVGVGKVLFPINIDDPFMGSLAAALCDDPISSAVYLHKGWSHEQDVLSSIQIVWFTLLQCRGSLFLCKFDDVNALLGSLLSSPVYAPAILMKNCLFKKAILSSTTSIRLHMRYSREALDDASLALSVCRQLQPFDVSQLVQSLVQVAEANIHYGRFVDCDRALTKALRLLTKSDGSLVDMEIGILTPLRIEAYLSEVTQGVRNAEEINKMQLCCGVIINVSLLMFEVSRFHDCIVTTGRIREEISETLSTYHPLYTKAILLSHNASTASGTCISDLLGSLKLVEEAAVITQDVSGLSSEDSFRCYFLVAYNMIKIYDYDSALVVSAKIIHALHGYPWDLNIDINNSENKQKIDISTLSNCVNTLKDKKPHSLIHCEALYCLAECLYKVRHYDTALESVNAALHCLSVICTEVTSNGAPQHPMAPNILFLKSKIYIKLVDYPSATEAVSSAIQVVRLLWGYRHIRVTKMVDLLGVIYTKQRKYEAAVEMFAEALDLCRYFVGRLERCHRSKKPVKQNVDSKQSVSSASSDISVVSLRGDNIQKEGPVGSSINLDVCLHPVAISSISRLGNALFFLGNADGAVDHHVLALKLATQLFGENSIQFCKYLMAYGNVLYSASRWTDAENSFKKCVHILSSLLSGVVGKSVLVSKGLTAWAHALERQQLYEEARPVLERCLRVTHGNPHASLLDIAMVLHNLGVNSYNIRDWDSAESFFETCLQFRCDAGLPPEHPLIYGASNWKLWVSHVRQHPSDWMLQRVDVPSTMTGKVSATFNLISRSLFKYGM